MSDASTSRPGPASRACAVCGSALSARDILDPICAAPECRRRFYLERHRRQLGPVDIARRERAARNRAAAETRARLVLGEPADRPTLPLAVVPAWWEPRLTSLPERRRRVFRDRLMRLLSEATASRGTAQPESNGTAAPEELSHEMLGVLGRVCGVCQGWCCRNGGVHAYITADTLRRYLAANPGRRPREVLDDYLDRVGHKTYRNSCIYHERQGCRLPREMRSDTCNDFLCTGLVQFRDDVGGVAPARAAVVTQADGVVGTVAIFEGSETRFVPLPVVQ